MTGEISPKSGSGQSASRPRLCQACLSVLAQDDYELERSYPHHSTLRAFIEASNMRCYVCSWLLSRLHEDDQSILRRLAEGRTPDHVIVEEYESTDTGASDPRAELLDNFRDIIQRWNLSDSWVSFTVMRIEATALPEGCRKLSVYLSPSYEGYFPLDTGVYDTFLKDCWKRLTCENVWGDRLTITSREDLASKRLAMSLPSHTGSTETWSTVNQWVQVCSELHSCTAKVNRDWYPTRLIERMPNERFRIIRSDSSLFQPGRGYITLSHRWGNDDFVKLTKDNLSEFENGFPTAKLRKTFQDTLIIAERMDIPYVWIDSLCIIQSGDNKKDWQQESGLMAEIYSNSFCNISADWGDGTSGLFFERTPIFEPPCAIQMRWKSPNSSNEFPRLPPDEYPGYIVRNYDWIKSVGAFPLNRRGWVLQERLLAPRVLHFSPEQVSWECRDLLSWEKAPWLNDLQVPRDFHHDWIGNLWVEVGTTRANLDWGREVGRWHNLVSVYTECDLTQESDRLVAFAGIAKRLAPVKGQYVAGLWAKSLPGALLWHARRTKRSRAPQKDYQYYAPTFSWAAADDTVDVPNEPDEEYRLEREYLPDEPDERYRLNTGVQFIVSAAFIKHRDRSIYAAATTQMRTELDGQSFTDHIFGPLTSPKVEVRARGILRSCRRVPPRLVPSTWSEASFPPRGNSCARPSKGVDDPAINHYFEADTTFGVDYDRAGDEDVQSDSTVYYYTIIQLPREPGSISAPAGRKYDCATGLFLKSVDANMGRLERLGLVTHYGDQQGDICQPLGNERDLPAWSYNETTGEHTFYIV